MHILIIIEAWDPKEIAKLKSFRYGLLNVIKLTDLLKIATVL